MNKTSGSIKYILIFSILTINVAVAQKGSEDQLNAKLSLLQGAEKVDALNQLTYRLISTDNVKAMQYCDQSIALGIKSGYQKGLGRAYTYRGVYENLSGEFSNGRNNLRRGLNLSTKVKDKENVGYTLLQLGNSFLDQAEFDSSRYFYDRSYDILKDSTNPKTLSKLYRNLSTLQGILSQKDLQRKYLLRAFKIRELLGDKTLIADALIILASLDISDEDFSNAEQKLNRAHKILLTNPGDLENLNDWRHQEALILLHENKFDQALVLFDSAENFYSRKSLLNKYVTLQTDLGKAFYSRGDYEMALKCFYDASKIAELKSYDVEFADIQLQIGWLNLEIGELKQCLTFANLALARLEGKSIPNRTADAFELKGVTLTSLKDFKAARICLDTALLIRQKLQNKSGISEVYESLGYLEQDKGNLETSLNFYQKALEFAETSKFKTGKVWALIGLGAVNFKLNRFEKASKYLSESEQLASELKLGEALIYVYGTKKDLLAGEKKFKESLHYSELAYTLNDSLHRSAVGRRFTNLQQMDEIRQRDENIKSLVQEKQLAQDKIAFQTLKLNQQYYLIFFGIGGIILLSALAFVYARFYFRVKRLNLAINKQKEEIELQSVQLTESNSYISKLNKNLEFIVAEKTLDLQRTNEALIKQNNELLQFSYTVSHNLRGPVARMLGLTNVFRYSTDAAEQSKMMAFVNKASQDLDNTLRDLSRIIDIKNDLHSLKDLISLEEEWLKSYELLKDSLSEHADISYNFERAPKIFTIRAFIQSAFYNLLSNSIKYRSPDRELVVFIRSFIDNNMLIIEIQDNGSGIDSQKHKDSIFKLFKRFHTHVEGRGLGLYLIKSQIEALNGSIEIETMVDQGTFFKIEIPYSVSEEALK